MIPNIAKELIINYKQFLFELIPELEKKSIVDSKYSYLIPIYELNIMNLVNFNTVFTGCYIIEEDNSVLICYKLSNDLKVVNHAYISNDYIYNLSSSYDVFSKYTNDCEIRYLNISPINISAFWSTQTNQYYIFGTKHLILNKNEFTNFIEHHLLRFNKFSKNGKKCG